MERSHPFRLPLGPVPRREKAARKDIRNMLKARFAKLGILDSTVIRQANAGLVIAPNRIAEP
jgi:hypothetical protein